MSGVPEVVDENGNPITGPAMSEVLNQVQSMAVLANIARMRKSIESNVTISQQILDLLDSNRYEGKIVEVTLNCVAQNQRLDVTENNTLLKVPTPPWAVATFINDGPDTAYILINDSPLPFSIKAQEVHPVDCTEARGKQVFPLPYPVKAGEVHPVEYTEAGSNRIAKIAYWCDPGNTASVRVKGKY